MIRDAKRFDRTCTALVEVQRIDGMRARGRTELSQTPCQSPPLQGWHVQVRGTMRRPQPGAHPLLPGPAERLARLGCWSQVRVDAMEVIAKPWTPVSNARRLIAQRLQRIAGEQRGGVMAALVLGSAQVSLPEELRQAFRVAGLSHALAASGFHLSVLLGSTLALTRRRSRWLRLSSAALVLTVFVLMAGAQPSVVRAVLMGAIALLIRESCQRSRGEGVLLLSLTLMLLFHPGWAASVGFQLSAAATAGLVLTAPALEASLDDALPRSLVWLAPALAVPLAALVWTLPLQLLHFGSAPLYAVLSNLLVSPLLAPLTLASMIVAMLALLAPLPVLIVLIWPVQHLAGALIALVIWISHWPGAQLLTGHPQPVVVIALALGLLPWLLVDVRSWRKHSWLLVALAVLWQGVVQLGDAVVTLEQHGRHWLLARHSGRAALISSHGDERSCLMARRLAHVHGHGRLDWILLLDPVAGDVPSCWDALARTVRSVHTGHRLIAPGQTLTSSGLAVNRLQASGASLLLQAGGERWLLLPQWQDLQSLQQQWSGDGEPFSGIWLGFRPTRAQRRWLAARPVGVLKAAI